MVRCITTLCLALTSTFSFAAPFETCPSKAYLFQSKPVKVYGVNLVTGQTSLLEDNVGLGSVNINAVGFDFDDRYIYGYDTTYKRLVRLGKDLQAEVLNTTGLPTSHTFFVGDVYEHVYYMYRQNKGLFKVDLSPLDTDPSATLEVVQISTTANVRLTDFAFHPGNDHLYGVDNSTGILHRFDTTTGAATVIGDVGVTGTFGAGYFDVNGYYYISRNSDGNIYRIDLSSQDNIDNGLVTAVKFADGPSSNQNDGARCANAPVIDEDSTIDFADAPDSYKTLLASNGPRHQADDVYYLGTLAPDTEGDGFQSPLDDNKSGTPDEDGVGFVTSVEADQNAIISVNASTTGYLSAWLDWNRDGDFEDSGEKIISDSVTTAGANAFTVPVPANAEVGSSWSRFRFSNQTELDFYGGATSGEVEDHPVTILENGSTLRYYPNASGYATLAFEDNWPKEGDYDMNDVVIRYRVTETVNIDQDVTRVLIQGYLAAYGAGYHNGFAVRLGGINREDIHSISSLKYNAVQQDSNGLAAGAEEAIFIVADDLQDHLPKGCMYYRTAQHCQEPISFEFELDVYFNSGADPSGLMTMPYDPYMFATPGSFVRDGLWYNPGRGLEIHLPDQAPTENFDTYWYGWWSDSGVPAQGRYFKTPDNHPWALIIAGEWKWPKEHVDLVEAYPEFAGYAESGGENNLEWYLAENAAAGKFYSPEE